MAGELEVPVVVVGGSLVGLSTAALLGAAGVETLVVERHRGTAIHPRAASFHQRTMEVFRGLGLQPQVEEAAAREFEQNGAIVAVESLCGPELAYFYTNFNDGVEGLSPTSRLFITQIGLEPLLRARAQELGAEHRFGAELVGFDQDEHGVRCVVRDRDSGAEQVVRSRYLVAADGAHSTVRDALGIRQLGRGDFAHCITIYFRADVAPMLRERNLSVVYVNHPSLLGFFRFSFTADSGFLAVFSTTDADGNRTTDVSADLSPARCVDHVRTALGCGVDVPVEIDDVQPWRASAGWAERFAQGRVFLVGDAAHVMPPTGGFGGNTGVADAHNLAWKLAAVLSGAAGPGLLDSYDAERRPVAALTTEQAYTRYVLRVDPSLPQDDLAAPLDDAAIELGARYRSDAVVSGPDDDVEDGDSAPLDDPRAPGGRVGARGPHVSVRRGDTSLSVLDVFGPSCTLLAGPDGHAWVESAQRAAADLGVPLPAYRVGPGGELDCPAGAFETAYGVARDGAVLVRPDGVVGWKAGAAGTDVGAALSRLLARA